MPFCRIDMADDAHSTAYKPDVAARLAQALLQDSTPTTTGDDVKMRADDSDDEDIFDETPVERLSLRGYVLLLLSGSKTCDPSLACE